MSIIKLYISTRDGNKDANPLIRRRVNALKIGQFAVHKSGIVWNVTHINSGYYIREFFNPLLAKKYAEFVNKMQVDWRRVHGMKDLSRIEGIRIKKAAARIYANHLNESDRVPNSVYFPKRSTEPGGEA